MNDTLLIGYGNPDRQDDGLAWHILRALAQRHGLPAPLSYEDEFPPNDRLDFAFHLQLTPEMAGDIAPYRRVCFIDAHAGDIPDPIRFEEISGGFQRSPFTHHLTPQSLLAMCLALYRIEPQAALLTVRGHRFQFERELSPQTAALLPAALQQLEKWLKETS